MAHDKPIKTLMAIKRTGLGPPFFRRTWIIADQKANEAKTSSAVKPLTAGVATRADSNAIGSAP